MILGHVKKEYSEKDDLGILGYCLMSNHESFQETKQVYPGHLILWG